MIKQDNIKVLSFKDHSSKSMWAGSKETIDHFVREMLDNSFDEVVKGAANIIEFSWDEGFKKIRIIDNGSGIKRGIVKVPMPDKTFLDVDSVVAVFTIPFAGGKHDNTGKTLKGTNGVGLKLLNATSLSLVCRLRDNKNPYVYHEYKFIDFDEKIEISEVTCDKKVGFSTFIEAELNPEKFKSLSLDKTYFRNRCLYVKSKFPELKIKFGDEIIPNITQREFFYHITNASKESKVHTAQFKNLNNNVKAYIAFDNSRTNSSKSVCNMDFVDGAYSSEFEKVLVEAVKTAFNYSDITKRDVIDGCKVFFDMELANPSYIGQTKHLIEDNIATKLRI
jgi:DNA gyrase/topoisomerase IV subunit B